jgi:hypothetical protein
VENVCRPAVELLVQPPSSGIPETSVDNHFTRQYIPEDNSEHHTRRRENLKSHKHLDELRL